MVLGRFKSFFDPDSPEGKGVVRVKVLPEEIEHTASGRWDGFKKTLDKLFRRAVDEDLAEAAVHAAKSKLDEQSYKNKHVAAQIESEVAETRLRHAEAKKSASFLHSERRLLDAQADKTEAEAAKIRAEAQTVSIDNQLKLLEKFGEYGMKFAPVVDEDGCLVGATIMGVATADEQGARLYREITKGLITTEVDKIMEVHVSEPGEPDVTHEQSGSGLTEKGALQFHGKTSIAAEQIGENMMTSSDEEMEAKTKKPKKPPEYKKFERSRKTKKSKKN